MGEENTINKYTASTGSLSKKPVSQYDLNGNFIETYGCALFAARKFNSKHGVSVVNCCTEKQKTAFGFKWKYAIENI
jgi:hypothetical protein